MRAHLHTLGLLLLVTILAGLSQAATNNVPLTPVELGTDPPDPVITSTEPETFVVSWSDGTATTNTIKEMVGNTNVVVGIVSNVPPTTVVLKVTYYDCLTSNAIYSASFETAYRENAFMKTEIIEQ